MAHLTLKNLTWHNAYTLLDGRTSVKIGYETWLEQRQGYSTEGYPIWTEYAVRYYGTDILTVRPDDIVTINTGGHRTVTTKQRINALTPLRVFAKNRTWFAKNGVRFYDGMRINYQGMILA